MYSRADQFPTQILFFTASFQFLKSSMLLRWDKSPALPWVTGKTLIKIICCSGYYLKPTSYCCETSNFLWHYCKKLGNLSELCSVLNAKKLVAIDVPTSFHTIFTLYGFVDCVNYSKEQNNCFLLFTCQYHYISLATVGTLLISGLILLFTIIMSSSYANSSITQHTCWKSG